MFFQRVLIHSNFRGKAKDKFKNRNKNIDLSKYYVPLLVLGVHGGKKRLSILIIDPILEEDIENI